MERNIIIATCLKNILQTQESNNFEDTICYFDKNCLKGIANEILPIDVTKVEKKSRDRQDFVTDAWFRHISFRLLKKTVRDRSKGRSEFFALRFLRRVNRLKLLDFWKC